MRSKINEQALEASIEKVLVGYTCEELKELSISGDAVERPLSGYPSLGYEIGKPHDFDKQLALDLPKFWKFLNSTQSDEIEKLKRYPDWKRKIVDRFNKMIKKYGIVELLRNGLEVEDAVFALFYPVPLKSSGENVIKQFNSNIFSVTRQLQYSIDNPREEIDMVIFINGIPIITIELKNPWTGQNAKYHGVKQYINDRDNKQPLLSFARCIVHMAVDTNEVYMTTKLNGSKTFFLPFNKGNNNGKGNPVNPNGHRTEYLWKEVFTKESMANLILHFVRLDGKKTDNLNTRTLFFPRYHQMDVVRRIIKDCEEKGVGQSYLIQHSAGSGKSNSITWTAFQLIETYPDSELIPGSHGVEYPLFDSVIVVTDRTILNKQLKENIKSFSQIKNIVAKVDSSSDLKVAMESGKKIIVTTIQKFPYISDGIQDLSTKRFAVIIDEAHSSQSGTLSDSLNESLGGDVEEDNDIDIDEFIIETIKSRKMSKNASFMAFTATPKNSTLEKFGRQQSNGKFEPFHLYSMKQAIEEEFILDVVSNYTTYKSYYEIKKSIEDNPEFDTVKAQKKLKAFVEKHPKTIETKSEIMLDHFINNVVNTKKLKGKAKAIVATHSIESAIRYYQTIKKLLDKKGNPFRVAIAFSGKKKVDGIEYTEESINSLPSSLDVAKPNDPDYITDKLARYFDMDEFKILIVANKYLTGFDQPKLTAMYVDKKLQGVLAVQALSRLNRANKKLGKRTEDLFVLDFFNEVEEIKKSFDPFYTATTLSKATDVNVLHTIKNHLDDEGVYEWFEVEKFNELFFRKAEREEFAPILDVAADRFNFDLELSEEDKADFKIKAKQFVKIYRQVAAIMEYEMVKWEKLHWFLKFLIPDLKVVDPKADALDELMNSVDLSTYGLERTKIGHTIGLDSSETEIDPTNPNPRGAHSEEEQFDPLDEIIKTFNERFYGGWEATPEEQRVKLVALNKRVVDHPDYHAKVLNNFDEQNRDLAFNKIVEDVVSSMRRQEIDFYKLFAKDDAFKRAFISTMKEMSKKSNLNINN